MDAHLKSVTDEFIRQRVSYYGQNETKAVNDAFLNLRSRAESLKATLTEKQAAMLRACENAYSLADGETARFYYMGGFKDAIHFLMDWRDD